jgi:uncharacterized protein involved in exopolysaccharide biosynthesis
LSNSEISHFFELIRRRWLVFAIVCVVGLCLLPIAASSIPAYKGKADLLIVSQTAKDTTLSDPDIPSIVTSTSVLDRVIKRLRLGTDPIALAKKIKTKLPAKSSILEITYHDTDGIRAAAITNAIADEAAMYFHGIATRGYSQVLTALDARIAESHNRMALADRALQRASAQSAFVSSDKALDDLTSQIDDLCAQRAQGVASLAADEAAADALSAQAGHIASIARGEILEKDVIYQRMLTDLGKDVADLASEQSSFRPDFPGLSALAARVARERRAVKAAAVTAVANGAGESASATQTTLDIERAKGQVASDEQRLRAIDGQIADEQSHLQRVAVAGATVGTLRAERDAALQQYMTLTQRLSNAKGDAAQAASLGTLVVVSRAIPGPSLLWAWLVALSVAVLGLAISAAYAAEAIDRRLWGSREMGRTYGRPVIEMGAIA